MDSLHILIAEDHPLFRKGMRTLLMRCVSPLICNARVSAWLLHVKRNAVASVAICMMGLAQRWPRYTCKLERFVR